MFSIVYRVRMKNFFQFLLSFGCLSLLIFSFPFSQGCQEADLVSSDPGEKVVRRYMSDNPKEIDPHLSSDTRSSAQCGMVYEQLYEYSYFQRPPKLEPCLAADMPQVSDDGLVYTIPLRQDVYFQDDPCFKGGKGRQMTAHDLLYSIKRFASALKSNGWSFLQGKVKGLDDFRSLIAVADEGLSDPEKKEAAKRQAFKQRVSGLEVLDDFTFRFTLNDKYPQFIWVLCLSFTAVVPHEAVEYYGDDFFRHPVGTGPFMLDRWVYGHEILWKRNPRYREVYYPEPPEDLVEDENGKLPEKYQGLADRKHYLSLVGKRLPLADKVHFRIIKESQSAWLEFLAGNLDIFQPDKDQFTQAIQGEELSPSMEAKGLRVLKYNEPTIEYISYNFTDPVVGSDAGEKGKAIRKALGYAIDRDYFIEKYENGQGEPATTLVPKEAFGSTLDTGDALSYASYNPEKGREVMRKAGFLLEKTEDGWIARYPENKKEVEITVLFRSPRLRDHAIFFASSAREVGIKLIPEFVMFQEFLRRQKEQKGQVYHAGWVLDYPDAQNILVLLHSSQAGGGYNSANFKRVDYDTLFEQIEKLDERVPQEKAEKLQLIKEINAVLEEHAPWAPLRFYRSVVLQQSWAAAIAPNPYAYNLAKYHTSDGSLREQKVVEWKQRPFLPGFLILALSGLLGLLFFVKVVRGS